MLVSHTYISSQITGADRKAMLSVTKGTGKNAKIKNRKKVCPVVAELVLRKHPANTG